MPRPPTRNGARAWTIEQVEPTSHVIRFEDIREGWEQWVMLSSDRHHDNQLCRQDIEREHLELARQRNAIIIDAGDLFCAMQGKGDPRGNFDNLRPEHKTENYLDALVDTAAEFYAPYAHNFALLALGNHETAVSKHRGTGLTDRLAAKMRAAGGVTLSGQYAGWVTFRFLMRTTVQTSRRLFYFHGSGGGGPVTRGTISSNRLAVNAPDADIVLSGHTHDAWMVSVPRYRIGESARTFQDIAYHLRTPTYKDEFSTGSGWAVEKGLNPKPLGCIWLHWRYVSNSRKASQTIELDVIPQFVAGGMGNNGATSAD